MADRAGRRGLGRGFDALFEDETPERGGEVIAVPIEKVEPKQDQPRTVFDEEALANLADSISRYGLIQPITVRALDRGYYQIIAGERRWRAARLAGLAEVPVRVTEADDRTAMELALVENLQREDLNPIEEARGYRTLMEDFGLSQDEAARAVGKSRPAVANSLRLLGLCGAVLAMVESGRLSAGHARALLPVKDAERQQNLAETVEAKRLSVRQTETLVSRFLKELERGETEVEKPVVDYVREAERELENALGRKVKLVDSRKRGRIELEFYGADDREALIGNLLLLARLRAEGKNTEERIK